MKAIFVTCLVLTTLTTPLIFGQDHIRKGTRYAAKPCGSLPFKFNTVVTTEKNRRYFSKVRCIHGDIVKTPFIEVTYMSVDKCGKVVEWSKVYRDMEPYSDGGKWVDPSVGGGGGGAGGLKGLRRIITRAIEERD